MRIGLYELPDGEAIRGFLGGNGDVFANPYSPLGLQDGAGFEAGWNETVVDEA